MSVPLSRCPKIIEADFDREIVQNVLSCHGSWKLHQNSENSFEFPAPGHCHLGLALNLFCLCAFSAVSKWRRSGRTAAICAFTKGGFRSLIGHSARTWASPHLASLIGWSIGSWHLFFHFCFAITAVAAASSVSALAFMLLTCSFLALCWHVRRLG